MSEHSNGDSSTSTTTSTPSGNRRPIEFAGNRLDARDLFVSTREIIIIHGDENYRLRLTAQNKLILTK